MLFHKLIQAVEEHSELIVSQTVEHIRRDPRLPLLAKLPHSELALSGRAILGHLGEWLGNQERSAIGDRFELIGRSRYLDNLPLDQTVLGLQILKEHTIEYIRDQGFPQNSLEFYAEEQLELRVDRFFDFLVYHLVFGYEKARRQSIAAQPAHA
jgi:hypothetical protein